MSDPIITYTTEDSPDVGVHYEPPPAPKKLSFLKKAVRDRKAAKLRAKRFHDAETRKGAPNRKVWPRDDLPGGIEHTYHATKGDRFVRKPQTSLTEFGGREIPFEPLTANQNEWLEQAKAEWETAIYSPRGAA